MKSSEAASGDDTGGAVTPKVSTYVLLAPSPRQQTNQDHEAHDTLLDDVVDQNVVVLESADKPQKRRRPKNALDLIQEAPRASHEKSNYDDNENDSNNSNGEEENDDDDDEVYRYVYLNAPQENAAQGYCNNTVVTSRFTVYNFLPKLLFYEFSKLANAYFLVISVMQTVKPISNTGGFPASLPALTIIVLIDMFFACLEDYKRHKADHIANELPCRKFSLEARAFEPSKWQHLHVGDVVKLYNREAVPADLVILGASEPDSENPAGICYVETKSLDGETNLKLRQGLEATYTMLQRDEQIADLAGVVICETPNNSIHRFNGSLSLQNGAKEAITTNAIVLRGSTLRNTEYIYGLVVNTGPDTKIMMASSNTPMKWSNMERRLNRQIMYICALMVVLCLTGATASAIWNHSNLSRDRGEGAWYLFDKDTTAKAQLVHLVRDNNPEVRTLAIGDGANDVSMIQAAHVGVGISGQEGMQAANSSDYAIAQFRFLSRLLLVHGRWNYVRMGKLILYIFYKNVMMNLTQFWYMIFTGFSGQKFFLEWGLQGYNLLFTALPIVLISTLEQDVPAHLAHNYPLLYRIGQENSHFNTKIVWAWISSCVWESLIISFGTLFGMRYLTEEGDTPTMWVYGCTAFTIVLLVVTLKLCLHQQMWWPAHLAIYVCSVSLWVVTAAIISNGNSISSAYWNGVFSNSFGVQVFWLLVPLLTFTALSRDFLWKGYIRAFRPSYKHLAQEVSAFGLTPLADKLLAFPPAETIPWGDMEAPVESVVEPPRRSRVSTSEAIKMAVLSAAGAGSAISMPPRPLPSAFRLPPRKSVSRGSAFSYDAESVMVESFMATERYNNQEYPQDARTLFERHASRGSMAFHGLPTSEAVAHALGVLNSSNGDDDSGAARPRGRERLHSAGNIFRGARHSFVKRPRFGSASTVQGVTTNTNATTTRGSLVGSTSDVQSPSPYHQQQSAASSAASTPHTPGDVSFQQQQQQGSGRLVRRYTAPRYTRQMSA
uniref:Uncharacterized protein n=1 Tax=Globisporangium ultimum (strain ATCC 200006 / CBS 805.95 / DAOM BR144) TaxID=431595 RepID=K3X6U0_GLOUD